MSGEIAQVQKLLAEGKGERAISTALNLTRHQARKLVEEARLSDRNLPAVQIEPRTVEEFAKQITARWQQSLEAILDVGGLLIRAKASHPGKFGAMIDSSLPFGAHTAQRLMAIASDGRLTDPAHVRHLPPHWGTLYEIHKLDDATLQARIADGTIRPDMERKAIAAHTKQARRTEREAMLGAKQIALPTRQFGVVLADPPWRFEPYSRDSGLDRAADNHYPTMTEDSIAALPVASIAADDCVLFLWATAPMLPQALQVMAAWGFAYKSHAVWRKDTPGTGYWFRSVHELVLVGTRGSVPAPSFATALSVFDAPQAAHSQKPDLFVGYVEAWFPNLPKVELFARAARSGWATWGQEAPE